MKKLITGLVASILAVGACQAQTAATSVEGNIIGIPSIELNGVRYNNVYIRVLQAEVLQVGKSSVSSGLPKTCEYHGADRGVSLPTLRRIAMGMTLDQVNQLIGCEYNPSREMTSAYCAAGDIACLHDGVERYVWGEFPRLWVEISKATGGVTYASGGLFPIADYHDSELWDLPPSPAARE